MTSPASSHTTRNRTTTMMLFRLLRVIWWYIYRSKVPRWGVELSRLALRPLASNGVFQAPGRVTAPDLGPHQTVAESRYVLSVVLEVVDPHGPVALVRHLALRLGCGGPDVMGCPRCRQIEDFPAAQLQPVAQ